MFSHQHGLRRTGLVDILSCSALSFAPHISSQQLRELSFASVGVLTALVPASRRAARAEELAGELRRLPFEFDFDLQSLGPEALEEVVSVLRALRLMRRREIVGHGAGWAPTEDETWRFKCWEDVGTLLSAAKTARSLVQREGGQPALLLAGVLRQAPAQFSDGPLLTASMGLEWVEGPAADPLQLGIHLALGCQSAEANIELELGSGGWSPWAETWALSDRTMEAQVAAV